MTIKLPSYLKPDYLVQAIMIFLSVSLAILAGNWNEERKEEQNTREFLVLLVSELKGNHARIEKSIEYHATLKPVTDSLFRLVELKEIPNTLMKFGGTDNIPGWKGTGFATMETAVYQSGSLSGITSNLPLELLTEISRLQRMHEGQKLFNEKLFNRMLALHENSTMVEMLITLSFLSGDLYYLEKEISTTTLKVIDMIEAELSE